MSGQPVSVKEIKAILTQKNLAPRKSLGQNFLADRNLLDKIVKTGEVTDADLVLEIGPGLGALTERLLGKAGQVVAVEYDRGLFSILAESLATASNLELINADILRVDLAACLEKYHSGNRRFKVVANLPYYITSPIIFKLLECGIDWELMVLLVQKEVARRIVSQPGTTEYGALTVMLNFYGRVETAGTIPKTVFYPVPKVDSAVIKFIPDARKADRELYPFLQKVVQAAFGQRRKTLSNAFATFEQDFGGKGGLAECLARLEIDPRQRGETLGVEKFLSLAREIQLRSTRGKADDLYQPN